MAPLLEINDLLLLRSQDLHLCGIFFAVEEPRFVIDGWLEVTTVSQKTYHKVR